MARNIVSGFLTMIGRRMATFLIYFAAMPIVVRVLGPSGWGNYAFAISVFSLLMVFVSSGVSEGVQKYVGEQERRDDWREHVTGFYLRLALLLALVGSVLLLIVVESGVLGSFLTPEFAIIFYVMAGMVFTAQLREYVVRVLRGLGVEHYSESLKVLHPPLFFGTGIALAVLGYGVVGMLVGQVVAGLIVGIVGLYLISRRVDLSVAFSPGAMDVPRRELLSFNFLNILLVLLAMSLYHVDVLMIRIFIGSEQTGIYKAALAVAEFMWFAPAAIQAMFIHSMSNLWSSGQNDTVDTIAARTSRYTALFSALLAVGIAALGGRFLPLYYGPEYAQSVTALLILLPGAIGFAIARPIYGIAQGKGNLAPMVAANAGAAAINIVLNAVLIPRYGIAGAAVATSIGYLSMLGFHTWSARRLGFHPLSDLRLTRIAATVIVAGVPIFFLANQLTNDLLAFLVVPPLGAVLFFLTSLSLGALDTDELQEIVSALPAPLRSIATAILERLPTAAIPSPGQ